MRKNLYDNGFKPLADLILINDKGYTRNAEFKKEIRTYGFSEVDTWNLDTTMIELLFERLIMYMDYSIVNDEFHVIEINGIEGTQRFWMGQILEMCIEYLEDSSDEFNRCEVSEDIWFIWSRISGYVWW